MSKLSNFFIRNKKKVALIMATLTLCLVMGTMCFASEGGADSLPDLTPITTALTKAITIDSLIKIIANLIGYSMPFVLMWFAYRFLKRAYVKAVMAGRL